MALLRLDSERCDRPRDQSTDIDRFARILAIAIIAGINAAQRTVDLADQLAAAGEGGAGETLDVVKVDACLGRILASVNRLKALNNNALDKYSCF